MEKAPFFSVIIPVYNRANRLDKALDSLVNQTFQNFETVVVDDCSTDSSFEVARNHSLKNKTVLRNDVNQERCTTRNNGIAAAQGTYICFLDSDDHHLPEHLQQLHDFICDKGKPEGFFFTNAFNERENGERKKRNCPDFEMHKPFSYFLRYTVNPQRWAVHKALMQRNLFDPKINICEDMDLSLRIVESNAPIFHLKEYTTCYVAAADSFTHSDSKKWERELDALRKIFSRVELQGKLPRVERWRLQSMCHYHLAAKAFEKNNGSTFWQHAIQSFFLYPKGYNGKTLKPLLVMMLYSIPILGVIFKGIKNYGR